MKARNISQRRLAELSGVNHSTISRLLRGERQPTLGTATKLADVLKAVGDSPHRGEQLFRDSTSSINPAAGVEYALRSDELLNETDLRKVMHYYLALRARPRVGEGVSALNAVAQVPTLAARRHESGLS